MTLHRIVCISLVCFLTFKPRIFCATDESSIESPMTLPIFEQSFISVLQKLKNENERPSEHTTESVLRLPHDALRGLTSKIILADKVALSNFIKTFNQVNIADEQSSYWWWHIYTLIWPVFLSRKFGRATILTIQQHHILQDHHVTSILRHLLRMDDVNKRVTLLPCKASTPLTLGSSTLQFCQAIHQIMKRLKLWSCIGIYSNFLSIIALLHLILWKRLPNQKSDPIDIFFLASWHMIVNMCIEVPAWPRLLLAFVLANVIFYHFQFWKFIRLIFVATIVDFPVLIHFFVETAMLFDWDFKFWLSVKIYATAAHFWQLYSYYAEQIVN